MSISIQKKLKQMSEKVFNVTPLTTTVRTYVAVNPTSSDENLAGYGNFLTSLYFRVISISFLLGGNTRKSCFRKLEG